VTTTVKPVALCRSGFARKRTLKAHEYLRREGAPCSTRAADRSDPAAERGTQEPKPDSGSSPLE